MECTGKEPVSNSKSNVSVLYRGSERIICLRIGFVLKLGFVPPDAAIGIGMGSRFCFSLFKNGS